MSDGVYVPPHARIAAWCEVSLATVRGWSSGAFACAHHYLVKIADSDPQVDLAALTRLWAGRWKEKHEP